jgi:glutaminyl-tRNA synthetase
MVVFDPLKVVITNYPEGKNEVLESEDNPEDENTTKRQMPFSKELYIERDDFMEVAPKKYFRLAPGQMVRLKSAYIIKCDEFIKDADGTVTELRCSYIPESKSGSDVSGINVKGVIHWVSIKEALPVEVRLYDRLFKVEDPAQIGDNLLDSLNTEASKVTKTVFAEPALREAKSDQRFQFMRTGYFTWDSDSTKDKLVFNRTVTLRDMWAKEAKKGN